MAFGFLAVACSKSSPSVGGADGTTDGPPKGDPNAPNPIPSLPEFADAKTVPHVALFIYKTEFGSFAGVKKGDNLKVIGHVGLIYPNMPRVPVTDCRRVTGNQAGFPAADLTREFTKDKSAAVEKYLHKEMIVEGIVLGRDGDSKIILEGHKP
jgi:hypothetical protein